MRHSIVLLGLLACGVARAAEPPREVAEFLQKWLADPKVKAPGIGIAAVNREGIVWSGGLGYADVERKRPMASQTRFQFASVTKVYTALILAQLAAEHKIDLDAPLTRYVPEFKSRYPVPGAPPITVRHLATHTSGLTNWWGSPSHSYTARQLVERQQQVGLAAPPGFQEKYSNKGYALLGLVLERATGQSYAHLIRQRVFEPLQLKSSGLTSLPPHPDLAVSYEGEKGKLAPQPASELFLAQDPASALVATIDDVARFAHAHLAPKPASAITDEILDLLFTPHTNMSQHTAICLGWHYNGSGCPYWWHGGAWNAFYSRVVVRPDVGVGLVFSTNGYWTNDPTETLVRMLAPYADTSALDRHCGQYVGPGGKTLTVHRPPGPEMTLEIKGIGRIVPMGRHMFQIPSASGLNGTWVRFVVEDGRQIMLLETDRYVRREAATGTCPPRPTLPSVPTQIDGIAAGQRSSLFGRCPSGK